jgi:hypothetical protein
MTDRDTVRRALYDAIDWQQSYADSWRGPGPEHDAALDLVKRYRVLLKKRYGVTETPAERRLDHIPGVNIQDLPQGENRPFTVRDWKLPTKDPK